MRTLTPYGRWLSIDGYDGGLYAPWAFICWVHGPGGAFRIHTDARGSAERFVVNNGEIDHTVVREASMNGARVISQEDTEQRMTKFVIQGDFHEVYTFIPGTDVAIERFAGMVALLDFSDSRDGIVVKPAKGMGARVTYGVGTNVLADVASIDVQATDSAPNLPAVAGRPVRGGRLWRDDLHDGTGAITRTVLTIINDTAITTLTPFRPDDTRLRPLAESIDIRLN
jgi:hypothetical protein